jgi:hypothetical protein
VANQVKAMRENCSLNVLSFSHNLLFCSHKKDILFPQEGYFVPTRKIFCSHKKDILFPQESYFVPTRKQTFKIVK